MGDEAEQDTNDQGKRPSKFLPNGSLPNTEQLFMLMLLGMLSFNPLWERTKTQKQLCAQKHGTVGLPLPAAAEIFCLPLWARVCEQATRI